MGHKKYDESYISRDRINELLNSPNIVYETPDSFDKSIMNMKPTGKDRLRYRIEYLQDGTAIYYRRKLGDFKNIFCCF
ncbi:conserved Plasmodium protein, unknown function [Plasmodium ovale]|uniref:Uncharacterized protein n=2 Tax=Plasmodium ovale TaxID=36330 RepID=A0A1A8X497_PLAOA|nr:hypothetical protein POVCU2_0050940 [Plasmodium ovale curtisi]SBS98587.1 hypothetical protein POVCU1_047280 [Plasmodium ovale curtisi]SCQ17234.1 conserved Plasmodium protein, unknown function [Plasmodium ovale]